MLSSYISSYAICPRCGCEDIFCLGAPNYTKQEDGNILSSYTVTSTCPKCKWAINILTGDSIVNFFNSVSDSKDKAPDCVKSVCKYETKISFINLKGDKIEDLACEFLQTELIKEDTWISNKDDTGNGVFKRPSTPAHVAQLFVKIKLLVDNEEQEQIVYIPCWAIESLFFDLPNKCEEGDTENCKSILEITLIDTPETRSIFNSPKQLLFY